jgi:hypothetical protein
MTDTATKTAAETGHVHGPDCDHDHDHHGHVHGPDCNHGHHHHGPVVTYHRPAPKIGRNDVCPCGSGKKYKKCCIANERV